jgi:hypothetical protein
MIAEKRRPSCAFPSAKSECRHAEQGGNLFFQKSAGDANFPETPGNGSLFSAIAAVEPRPIGKNPTPGAPHS